MMRKTVCLFGNVQIPKVRCPECGDTVLAPRDVTVCCEIRVEVSVTKIVRVSEPDPDSPRLRLSTKAKAEILAEQADRCLYCQRRLGSLVYRKGKPVLLRCVWDHMIPYSYCANSHPRNIAAACHVCNGIKSSRVFSGLDEARVFILQIQAAKGYSDTP